MTQTFQLIKNYLFTDNHDVLKIKKKLRKFFFGPNGCDWKSIESGFWNVIEEADPE